LIMTAVLRSGQQWQTGYAIVGAGQLALAICFALTANHWRSSAIDANASNERRRARNLETLKLPVAWLGAAVFFVYTGIEAAAGTWAFSLFTVARGISMSTAGLWVSVYWFCLTAGRLLSGFVAGFVSQHVLLRFCVVGIAGGASMIWLGGATAVSFCGLALMGLASAPVFPGLISSSPQRLGDSHAANGIGFQIAAAVLGQSLLPALVGVLANRFGLEVVGAALLVSSVILIGMYLSLAANVERPTMAKDGVALVRGT
jgi:fucose permease